MGANQRFPKSIESKMTVGTGCRDLDPHKNEPHRQNDLGYVSVPRSRWPARPRLIFFIPCSYCETSFTIWTLAVRLPFRSESYRNDSCRRPGVKWFDSIRLF